MPLWFRLTLSGRFSQDSQALSSDRLSLGSPALLLCFESPNLSLESPALLLWFSQYVVGLTLSGLAQSGESGLTS